MITRYELKVSDNLYGKYETSVYLDFGIGNRADGIEGDTVMYPLHRLPFQHINGLFSLIMGREIYEKYGTEFTDIGTYYYKCVQANGELSTYTMALTYSVRSLYKPGGGATGSVKESNQIRVTRKIYDNNNSEISIGGLSSMICPFIFGVSAEDVLMSYFSEEGIVEQTSVCIPQTEDLLFTSSDGTPYAFEVGTMTMGVEEPIKPIIKKNLTPVRKASYNNTAPIGLPFWIYCYQGSDIKNVMSTGTVWHSSIILSTPKSTPKITGTSTLTTTNAKKFIYYFFANGKIIDPNETDYDPITPNIGIGDKDKTSDPIDFPLLPIGGLSGFYNVYELSLSNLTTFGHDIFNTELDESLLYWLKNSTPMDFIISLKAIPNLDISGIETPIQVGNISLNSKGVKLTDRYYVVDCGSYNCKEHFGNFKDFDSTKISIYLPFVGVVNLNTQDVMSATIYVKYYIDIVTADAICFLKIVRNKNGTILNSILYQYKCNVSSDYPLTATNNNPALKVANAVTDVAGIGFANSVNNSAPHSIQGQSNIDIINIRYPYLIIEREISAQPNDYNIYEGIKYKNKMKISDLKGYTQIEKIISPNISIPKAHLDLLEKTLQNGVYL